MLEDAWALAMEAMVQLESARFSEHLALAKAKGNLRISNPDSVRYGYRLVVETLRRRNLIDKFIESVIKPKKLDSLGHPVKAFLRLFVYQTRAVREWADADLEEAARIAKLGRSVLGWRNIRVVENFLGFLLSRQIGAVLKQVDDLEEIALKTFQPTWFVDYCQKLFGRNEALAFLRGNIYPPPFFIRLNTLKASEEEIVATLLSHDLKLERTEGLKHVFKVVASKRPLTSLQAYRDGFFYVQDKASCFTAEIADAKPGMSVLDVCASPGAKTTHLAQIMQNKGSIYSIDYSKRRIKTWVQENRRMDAKIAEAVIADARVKLPLSIEADIVLLDPPCTGTGSFGRQPSAKWRLSQKSVESMSSIQWRMINHCAGNVKSKGSLVYATGSIMVEENEMIIERFLKWHPEFHLTEIKSKLGLPGLRDQLKSRRFYPHIHESNGGFIAKLRRS